MFFVLALLFTAATASAQARDTAVQQIRLQAYGMASYVRPDFGGALKNAGGTIGANVNFSSFHGGLFEPSFDVRVLASGGRVSNQYVYGGGPRLVVNYGRLHTYAEFLLGKGVIHFNQSPLPTYTQDNSLVAGIAGGTDFSLNRTWAIRGEFLEQHWRLNDREQPFHPLAFSAGLRYQFHFRNANGPE